MIRVTDTKCYNPAKYVARVDKLQAIFRNIVPGRYCYSESGTIQIPPELDGHVLRYVNSGAIFSP